LPLTQGLKTLPSVRTTHMKKYNVGIIGYGWVAGAHITAINATGKAQVTVDLLVAKAGFGGRASAATVRESRFTAI